MIDQLTLPEIIRELMNIGKLPDQRADRLRRRMGPGTDCNVCDEPLTRDRWAFALEFDRKGRNSGVDKYNVHLGCLAAWEYEVAKLD